MTGDIRVGIGGWTFAPWRGVFYPEGLTQKRELEFAANALTSIEINGTYYSTFKPESWRKWRDETPDDFVFAVKASRFCTNRKILAEAGPAIERFLAQGLTELGDKLGPINWQFAATKRFDPDDFAAFLSLLPKQCDGVVLRHALEVRQPSFQASTFYQLARSHNAAVVFATGEKFPSIDEATADFTYARLMSSREDLTEGVTPGSRRNIVKQARNWAKRGPVYIYFISGAKVRNPAAAMSVITALKSKKRK
jgi:uncharacterized protein YecE (DUF72 family)